MPASTTCHYKQQHIRLNGSHWSVILFLQFWSVFITGLYWYTVHRIHSIKQQTWKPIMFITQFVEELGFTFCVDSIETNSELRFEADLRMLSLLSFQVWQQFHQMFWTVRETGLGSRTTVMLYLMSLQFLKNFQDLSCKELPNLVLWRKQRQHSVGTLSNKWIPLIVGVI